MLLSKYVLGDNLITYAVLAVCLSWVAPAMSSYIVQLRSDDGIEAALFV